MQEKNPCSKLTLHIPEGTQQVGRLATTWLDSTEEDLKTMGVTKSDLDQCIAILKEAKVHDGL
jgi:hypothetical protein